MIVSAAILSKKGDIFSSDNLPHKLLADVSKHAKDFLYAISIQDDEIELPYIETTSVRYIYKQTDDLYWLLVTKPESEMFIDINLLGRFVCTIMEYGSTETNSTTLTDEQRELFYRHIWRPWDGSNCSVCTCSCNSNSPVVWQREFESRLQFLISIRDGHVDDDDVTYFNRLISEAWVVSTRLSPDEFGSDDDSVCSKMSIGEETLIDCCKFKCRLEDIRLETLRIQDPYLRLFARRDLLVGSHFNYQISSAPSPSSEF